MAPHANPLRNDGERNVFCPHYSGCLDYACKRYWDFWSCEYCAHRKNSKPPRLEQFMYRREDDGGEGYQCLSTGMIQ